ncbi:hypothetical protein BOSE62_71409 [Bosea sp. 62]|jgi:hypothetical protein|nr:hypothetical protein BOSE21B_90210 [Bosea sp. 21B]CAD5294807.1 hypothetical protein BOSE46_80313 [Bosea sp. 46]CAD5298834.1 hypothetical protein BOSE7B_60455 [Bosea sp. 7B]VVT60857.1 hypothetical protein BOS5A_230134 [Bosea sp. EC-HK365B]VXB38603.1 hypothetical protein BOSE127_110453 [Bosea sp. 127]VXB55297.1 hypothetical protein BOSE125_131061 [Bosea sp. 125]VXC75091.1 hypothetical protein BOSE29B_80203 [Bosea sp. 29B]VXC91297.1 hypothetical protein BOSE62_71409 [Bosea sp. 62]
MASAYAHAVAGDARPDGKMMGSCRPLRRERVNPDARLSCLRSDREHSSLVSLSVSGKLDVPTTAGGWPPVVESDNELTSQKSRHGRQPQSQNEKPYPRQYKAPRVMANARPSSPSRPCSLPLPHQFARAVASLYPQQINIRCCMANA